VISSIRIIPIAFHLFARNENVLPVFSTFGVDVSVNLLDFSRVAVRVVATASRWIRAGATLNRIFRVTTDLVKDDGG
jgi:hypothetical protein